MIRQNNKLANYNGQGVIEYLLLIAAVLVVLLAFFANNGPFARLFNNVLAIQGEDMTNSAVTVFRIRE